MAGKARHNLDRAVRALMERNTELANAVIADDDEVDEHERHIDKLGMEMIVRFHPMASDLRLVVSSMKVSSNLERISDHAVNIAKRARKMDASAETKETALVEPLYMLADQLLRDAVSAYSDHDAELGAALHVRDKELDRMYKAASATFSERIEQSNGQTQNYLHLILVVRSIERVGDLAVNIGEDAVYVEVALDLRHESDRELK